MELIHNYLELVDFFFSNVNSYFAMMREYGSNHLSSSEEHTPYVDIIIKSYMVNVRSHEIVLYDQIQGLFHVKPSRGSTSHSSGDQTYHVIQHEHVVHLIRYSYMNSHAIVF